MPFVLLLLLALVSMQPRWPEPLVEFGPWLSPFAALAGLGLAWLVLMSLSTSRFRTLLARHPDRARQFLGQFSRRQRYLFLGLFTSYLMCLYWFGWGHAVASFWEELGPGWPGEKIVLVAPVLLGMLLGWARFYDFEKHAYEAISDDRDRPFPGRLAYLALHARFNFLLVVPPLVFMLLQESLFYFFPALEESEYLFTFVSMAFLGFAFVSIPVLLRFFLGLKPLPAGPLRDRLLETCRRTSFRCSDILLWNTRSSVANAMVTGVLPWARYIVITDRLARELTAEEMDAVLGHEIGHVKHHHMLFFAVFLTASLMTLSLIGKGCVYLLKQEDVLVYLTQWELLARLVDQYEYFAALPVLAFLALYLFVVFGYISRHCERQADLFGCRTASCQTFINALEKVAVLNGIKRDRPGWFSSWRHPTIARRVDFLMRVHEDPSLESRFQRRLRFLKWSLTLGPTLGFACILVVGFLLGY